MLCRCDSPYDSECYERIFPIWRHKMQISISDYGGNTEKNLLIAIAHFFVFSFFAACWWYRLSLHISENRGSRWHLQQYFYLIPTRTINMETFFDRICCEPSLVTKADCRSQSFAEFQYCKLHYTIDGEIFAEIYCNMNYENFALKHALLPPASNSYDGSHCSPWYTYYFVN